MLIQNHILAHACAGKERLFSSNKTFSPRKRILLYLSFSCLVPVFADSKSHISTCLCWERRAFVIEKDIFTYTRVSIHLSFSYRVPVCADAKSHISTCLCWERKTFFIEKDIFTQTGSFNSLVIFLPSTCVYWFKIIYMSSYLCWERKAISTKKTFSPRQRVSIQMSFSCLIPVCADAKSHISTCLCWERRTFVINKDIFTKEESFISFVISLPSTCVCWFKITY